MKNRLAFIIFFLMAAIIAAWLTPWPGSSRERAIIEKIDSNLAEIVRLENAYFSKNSRFAHLSELSFKPTDNARYTLTVRNDGKKYEVKASYLWFKK